MSDLDDRLARRLRSSAPHPTTDGLFERLERRLERRRRTRTLQATGLAVVVVAGTLASFVLLSRSLPRHQRGITTSGARGGVIVYSRVGRTQHLWVVRPDGSGARQLTRGAGADLDPSISPNGRTVAFWRTQPHAATIYTIGIDGRGLTRLTDIPGREPAWSPDGSEIAFAGLVGVYVMNMQDHSVRMIVGKDFAASSPSWSPDGTRIAFAAPSHPHGGIRRGREDIWIADADGNRPTDITNTATLSESEPAWSPDGSRILFSRGTPTGSMLMTMSPAPDATPVALTDGSASDLSPAWSPDGRFIVFERGDDVYTARSDGSDLMRRATRGVTPTWGIASGATRPTHTASPAPSDLGLGYPVCHVRAFTANWGGSAPTAYLATKVDNAGGCPSQDKGFNVLAVDRDGNGVVDASTGPITCTPRCSFYAAPDLNSDATAELVLNQGGLAFPDSAVLSVYELNASVIGVFAFPDGSTTFDVSDSGSSYLAGAFCSTDGSGRPLINVWRAPSDAGATYRFVERRYRIDMQTLRFQLVGTVRDTFTDQSPWPPNPARTNRLCGAPATPLP